MLNKAVKNKKIFLSLDSLRGVSALSIAIFHFNVGSHFNNRFTENAGIMVDFFFVLSGFVITHKYLDRIANINDLISFQVKRFLRLYPLHIVMLVLFFLLECLRYLLSMKFGIELLEAPFEKNNLSAFFANILLIQNWVLSYKTFNAPSWTISAEFFNYAIFAALLVLCHRRRKLFVNILLISIVTSGCLIIIFRFIPYGIYGPLKCFYGFLIGALIYSIYDQISNKILFSSSLPSIIFLVSSSLIIIFRKNIFYELIPIFFGVTILILVLTDQKQTINKVLSNKFLVYLGTISYGIYMIHMFVWISITRVARFLFKFPTAIDSNGNLSVVFENIILADLVMLSGLILIISLAHLSYKYLETRFKKQHLKLNL